MQEGPTVILFFLGTIIVILIWKIIGIGVVEIYKNLKSSYIELEHIEDATIIIFWPIFLVFYFIYAVYNILKVTKLLLFKNKKSKKTKDAEIKESYLMIEKKLNDMEEICSGISTKVEKLETMKFETRETGLNKEQYGTLVNNEKELDAQVKWEK